MKLYFRLTPLLSAICFIRALDSNPPEEVQDISVLCEGSGERQECKVELDVPVKCIEEDTKSYCPIVFYLHGSGGTIEWFAKTSEVHNYGAIGVYPQGEGGWNTGPKQTNECKWDEYDCPSDPDEGEFIANIIAYLRDINALGNIYVTGNSNGAALAHRLAANAGDELPIKGILTKVTQLLDSPERSGPGQLNNNQPKAMGRKVSVLNIMGTKDRLIPYEGGSSAVFGDDDAFKLMSAIGSMEVWASHNGCDTQPTSSTHTSDMGEVQKYVYNNCAEGTVVEHYAIEGAGHNAGGASIDNVKIDYDLMFGFINAIEGTKPSSPAPSTECEDDPSWSGKFKAVHTCDYVARNPKMRCSWKDANEVTAMVACKLTCSEDCSA